MRRNSGRRRTVYLHIGAPKTGTTFVQDALWRNRERLARQGVLYPLSTPDEHFAMTMDLRRMEWGGKRDPSWDGTWGRVAERIRSSQLPRAVLSNELLGGATIEQIRYAVDSLDGAELHVVFTARDLARQFPSDWQEQVRHTHAVPFEQYVDDLITFGRDAPAPFGEMFWGLHDPTEVLPTWAEVVGADHVHVITVPPAGSDSALLRHRIAEVVGIDPAGLGVGDDVAANRSLGVVEAELLRRLNARGLPERLSWMYPGLARLELSEWILARRPGQRRIVLPKRHRQWVLDRSVRIVDALRGAGYSITGNLDDLIPAFGDESEEESLVTESELLQAALDTIAAVLLRLGVVQNDLAD